MEKFILSAIAVGTMAIGGMAHADLIDGVGNTISRIFGVPYDARPQGSSPIVNGIYTNPDGRLIHVDPSGRHVPLDQYSRLRDDWGRTVYLGANNQPIYMEQDGRLVPYGNPPASYALGPSFDRDGDGVSNQDDRHPDDGRYR